MSSNELRQADDDDKIYFKTMKSLRNYIQTTQKLMKCIQPVT